MFRYMGQFSRHSASPHSVATETASFKKSTARSKLSTGLHPPEAGRDRSLLMPVEQMNRFAPTSAANRIRRYSSPRSCAATLPSSSIKFRQ